MRRVVTSGLLAACVGCGGGAGEAAPAGAAPGTSVATSSATPPAPVSPPVTTAPVPSPAPVAGAPSADRVTIRQVLVASVGAPGIPPTVTRSRDEARALAQRFHDDAGKSGADFRTVARQLLPAADAAQADGLMVVQRATLRPEFAERLAPLFQVPVGSVSEVFEIPQGFLVFKREADQPAHIVVDHILVATANPRMPNISRTMEEARARAAQVLEQAKKGGDWAALKREFSDDPPPGGPYGMANRGVQPGKPGEFPRDQMAPAFGDVGFTLAVGEIGLAPFDPQASPFGFHIIKRTE